MQIYKKYKDQDKSKKNDKIPVNGKQAGPNTSGQILQLNDSEIANNTVRRVGPKVYLS